MKALHWLQELFALVRPNRRLFRILVILTALGELVTLPSAFLFAWLIGRLQDQDHARTLQQALWLYAAVVLGLYLAQAGLRIARAGLNRRFSLSAANDLRKQFFGHLLQLPYPHFLEHHAGGQANSFLSDIDDIDASITGLVEVGIRNACLLVLYGAALLLWNPLIGSIAVVLIPLTVVGQRRLRARSVDRSRARVDLREAMMGKAAEAVANISVVKSFTMEDRLQEDIGALSGQYRDADTSLATYQGALRSLATVLLIFVQFLFFTLGAWMVMTERMTLGPFLGQMIILAHFTQPLNSLLDYGHRLVQSNAALHRVRETLAQPTEDQPHERTALAIPATSTGHGVALAARHLTFHYTPDQPLIGDWCFTINPGETVAIVGPSGSGKTTFFHLLLGFFDGFTGSLEMNGVDMRTLALPVLREKIGVVFQEHILFNASLRDNLKIGLPPGTEVNDEQLWQALDLAHARQFVEKLLAGLDTSLGVNGVMLSGGQRQRISLARVILKNPPLLLLDEATSALDSVSEQHIQIALRELFQHRTSIVIAHRLSTITEADTIIVLDEGRIVDTGSHRELLSRDGLYRTLYDAQVHGFIG